MVSTFRTVYSARLQENEGVCTVGNMSVNVAIEGEGLDPIDPLLDPTMGNMSVNVSIKGEGLYPLDPLLDPTMGNMSVNVAIEGEGLDPLDPSFQIRPWIACL